MTDEKNTKSDEIHKLGRLSYFLSSGELRDEKGNLIHIRKQSADVLSLLVEHSGELVTKDFLVQKVWAGISTTDDSLVQCIADIRRAAGKDTIETFPKKGYRLHSTVVTPEVKRSFRPGRKGLYAATSALALLFFIFILNELVGFRSNTADSPNSNGRLEPDHSPDLTSERVSGLESAGVVEQVESQGSFRPPIIAHEKTLAVLPFANLGGGSESRFFSDGLSEDLATDLSKVPGLTVISYASSYNFPDADSGFKSIADDLGVRYLVRGTVRHQEDRVRINVSLVDPADGFNVWTERYDKDRSNPFDVQEEVVQQIVGALSLKLGTEDADSNRIEPGAYYMLLRGLEPLRERTPSGNKKARDYFERALALDPEYARAHASLAVTYAREIVHNRAHPPSLAAIEQGLQAAVRAIQLDPGIPHAYFALGLLNLGLTEYDTALAAVRHSVKIDANFSDGYALLAEASLYGGKLQEAEAAIKRAKLLHPHHPPFYHWIEGSILYQQEQYEEARLLLEQAADFSPRFIPGLISLAANYGRQGLRHEASKVLTLLKERDPELDPEASVATMPYRYVQRREALLLGLKEAKAQ